MKWSWKLGNIAGIGIFVHWTFLLLPALIGYTTYVDAGPRAAAQSVVLVLAVFGCVLLHELGHALTARRFGIATRDITLLPIGGLARLERMPRRPLHELAVALAGPAVNVVIAAVLVGLLMLLGSPTIPQGWNLLTGSLLTQLLAANVVLVLFNMIPAFPMDGGRVLRAMLASVISYESATTVAARLGQVLAALAVLFALASTFLGENAIMLVFVGIFVFMAGQAELRSVRESARFSGWSVRHVMLRQFHMVPAHSRLEEVASTALFGAQRSFPVVEGNRLVGVLDQQQVLAGLSAGNGSMLVSDVMRRDFPLIDERDAVDATFRRMQGAGLSGLPVFAAGKLVGMLSLERMRQWLSYIATNAGAVPPRDTIDVAFQEPSHA